MNLSPIFKFLNIWPHCLNICKQCKGMLNLSLGIHILSPFWQINFYYYQYWSLCFQVSSLLVSSTFNVWTSRLSTSSYLCDPFHSNHWYWIFIEYFRKWMELWYFLFFSSFCIRFIYWPYLSPGIKLVPTEYNEEQLDFQMSIPLKNHGHISASSVTFAILGYGSAAGCSLKIR